jgi:hypothetical protein
MMTLRSLALQVGLILLAVPAPGCQQRPPTGSAPPVATVPEHSVRTAKDDSFAQPTEYLVVDHPSGELPGHRLEHCVLHAGAEHRESVTFRSAPRDGGAVRMPVTRHLPSSCSFNSECGVRRGQTQALKDGQVSIDCESDRCRCVVTTYVPPEVHNYTFSDRDPCQHIETLLHERCGG